MNGSECLLVYGDFSGSFFQVVEISLTLEKREELEGEGLKIPSLNGNSFQVKGDEKFVRRMARGIGEGGVIIKSEEGAFSGEPSKADFLKRRKGVSILQVLSHLSFSQ